MRNSEYVYPRPQGAGPQNNLGSTVENAMNVLQHVQERSPSKKIQAAFEDQLLAKSQNKPEENKNNILSVAHFARNWNLCNVKAHALCEQIKTAAPLLCTDGDGFATEFDILVSGPHTSQGNSVKLLISIDEHRFLWMMDSRLRADCELQLGICVMALTPGGQNYDLSLSVLAPEDQEMESIMWQGKPSTPDRDFARALHSGGGLIVLFPTNAAYFRMSPVANGMHTTARISFGTCISKPEEEEEKEDEEVKMNQNKSEDVTSTPTKTVIELPSILDCAAAFEFSSTSACITPVKISPLGRKTPHHQLAFPDVKTPKQEIPDFDDKERDEILQVRNRIWE